MNKFFVLFFCFFLTSCLSVKNRRQAQNHHRIAIELLSKCDNRRALFHLLKASKLAPNDFLIQNSLASAYYLMGSYDKAYKELKNLLKKQPGLTEARAALARVYISLGQPDQALKELEKAEKDMTYTNPIKIISQKGLAYYHKKKYRLAQKQFEEALSLSKEKSCFLDLQLGKTYLALGRLESAEKSLKKSFALCKKERASCHKPPYEYEEYLAFAKLYIKKKDSRRAKYYLNLFKKKSVNKNKIKQAEKLLKSLSGK